MAEVRKGMRTEFPLFPNIRFRDIGSLNGGHNTHFPSCFYFGDTKYAQSPATLLGIKSPAVASPPNESLLTINDAGDLWIKGQLYDHAFQSTITLDPAKEYWTLRDAAGKIAWALEVHNPGTGVSTGDLYSIGSFEGWAAEPDQTDAILRYTNASAQVVFSLSAAGRSGGE